MAEVHLDRVTIRFPVHGGRAVSGAPARVGGLIRRSRHGPPAIEALRDLSLSLAEGDRVGLIGHNGSGKSTLLRVIEGVYEPVAGCVRVSGRVLSLADPLLGMSLESTGRENVVLRGIYIGLTPRQALSRLDEIAEFSELGGYMDLPIKTWSAGMQLRLAFSISTAFDPDILLLDEQFGAGDASFLARAERRLEQFVDRAGIVVQASHSEALIRRTCKTVVLLEQGRLAMYGAPDEVFERYRERANPEAAFA